MSVDVQTYTLSSKDYKILKNKYSSPYLDLLPDYQSIAGGQIELFLTDAEKNELEDRLVFETLDPEHLF